jgi:ubiquinone/menaquinone biosynthesis C-methylase UbiE
LPFRDESFRRIIWHSVFQYFPNQRYAWRVLQEMVRVLVPGGRAMVLDVNDQAKKDECEAFRCGKLGNQQYRRLYADFPHLYYKRAWFCSFARSHHAEVEIFTRFIDGYENSRYRFNVVLRRPTANVL